MAEDDQESEDNAAEGGEGAEGEDAGKGFDAKKIILFVVLPLALLAGAGGGLYFSGFLDGFLGKGGEEHAAEDVHDDGHGSGHGSGGGVFLEIPPMLVNLSSPDGNQRYLRLSVQLELENEKDRGALEAVMPRVVDQFQTYLRELRVQDLRGSTGMYRLQMELLWRVNQAAAPVKIKDVLFQEILIQ